MGYRIFAGKLFDSKKIIICLALFLTVSQAVASPSKPTWSKKYSALFASLKEKLVGDGFSKASIDNLFNDSSVAFDGEGTGLFFVHNEGVLNYESFANKTSIWRAKKYLKKHKEHLLRVEQKFGVDKNIITAIILVETGLGTYVGKRRVLNTLSTMASISDPLARQFLWESIKDERRLSREKFEAKADEKSAWAYEELKAFIMYVDREGINPYDVYGSYAGALGIAQFMPTNILSFARDGNGDGKINLLNHSDAISSIASYLKHYGWHAGIENEKAEDVLYEYNHSSYYVSILMKISSLLKGKSG